MICKGSDYLTGFFSADIVVSRSLTITFLIPCSSKAVFTSILPVAHATIKWILHSLVDSWLILHHYTVNLCKIQINQNLVFCNLFSFYDCFNRLFHHLPRPTHFETFLWGDVEPLTWSLLPSCSYNILEDMMKLIDAGLSGLKMSNNIEVASLVLCLSAQVCGKMLWSLNLRLATSVKFWLLLRVFQ